MSRPPGRNAPARSSCPPTARRSPIPGSYEHSSAASQVHPPTGTRQSAASHPRQAHPTPLRVRRCSRCQPAAPAELIQSPAPRSCPARPTYRKPPTPHRSAGRSRHRWLSINCPHPGQPTGRSQRGLAAHPPSYSGRLASHSYPKRSSRSNYRCKRARHLPPAR